MPDYRYTLVDVFAERPLEGNLLPVIEGADAMADATMASLARRFNLSETSFIQRPTMPTATYRHRIFIVGGEIPFAGHPSLGTAVVWAYRHGLAEAKLVQQTLSGEQRLHVALAGRTARASLWQNPLTLGNLVDPPPVLASVALPAHAAHPTLPIQIVSTGLPTLVVPLVDPALLSGVRPDPRQLTQLLPSSAPQQPITIYLVAEEAPGIWHARSFGMDAFVGEDPATGSAAGAFGGWLKHHTGQTSLRIHQGVAMGCPSLLMVETSDGVVVSGDVHIIGEGTLWLPEE
jgi:trans-2,3-dihydro-3-hydroxyanthranilate isomerase